MAVQRLADLNLATRTLIEQYSDAESMVAAPSAAIDQAADADPAPTAALTRPRAMSKTMKEQIEMNEQLQKKLQDIDAKYQEQIAKLQGKLSISETQRKKAEDALKMLQRPAK
jgi:hypothetical protein